MNPHSAENRGGPPTPLVNPCAASQFTDDGLTGDVWEEVSPTDPDSFVSAG